MILLQKLSSICYLISVVSVWPYWNSLEELALYYLALSLSPNMSAKDSMCQSQSILLWLLSRVSSSPKLVVGLGKYVCHIEKEGRPSRGHTLSLLLLNTKWAKGHNEGRVSRDSSSSFEDCPHEKQHGLVRKKGQTALILACHIIGKRKRRRTPKAQNCCWVIYFFCPCKKKLSYDIIVVGRLTSSWIFYQPSGILNKLKTIYGLDFDTGWI